LKIGVSTQVDIAGNADDLRSTYPKAAGIRRLNNGRIGGETVSFFTTGENAEPIATLSSSDSDLSVRRGLDCRWHARVERLR
jgi:hypothetical protein